MGVGGCGGGESEQPQSPGDGQMKAWQCGP